MKDIIIVNPEKLEKIKSAIKKDGPGRLHILSDFDRTLIKVVVDGERIPGMMSVLYREKYLAPEYNIEAKKLHEKYHAIEVDPKIPRAEKKKAMKEWWEKAFDLVIKFGLDKKHIEGVINSPKLKPREGFAEMVKFLVKNRIPLVIMSSSGLGGEAISLFLEKSVGKRNNIHVICNSFNWDGNGKAVSVKQPIIYTMNKEAVIVKDFPDVFEKVKDRRNVILIGDSLDDIDMITGFDYDNLIKVGFLNEGMEENLENYKKAFDVLILDDGPMDYINNLLKELVK